MSALFNTHTVTGYTSGTTKPHEGQRLAKVTYKVDKKTGIKGDSKAVSIPVMAWADVESHLDVLKPEFMGLIHTIQDKIVRSKVESGLTSIQSEDINMAAIISWIQTESGRLTGDTIRAWFSVTLNDPLMLAFASKLGIGDNDAPTPAQESKLTKILKGYEDSFAKLASGAASFSPIQKEQLIKAMSLADDSDDGLIIRFTERLSKKADVDDELLMSL